MKDFYRYSPRYIPLQWDDCKSEIVVRPASDGRIRLEAMSIVFRFDLVERRGCRCRTAMSAVIARRHLAGD
jgi:hypothetical protein